MDKQNVTLAVPKTILRRARIIALEKQTSLSGMMTELLVEMVANEDSYVSAKRHHLGLLEHGTNLGTNGSAHWTREDLHER